jgi:hypothetical protein
MTVVLRLTWFDYLGTADDEAGIEDLLEVCGAPSQGMWVEERDYERRTITYLVEVDDRATFEAELLLATNAPPTVEALP